MLLAMADDDVAFAREVILPEAAFPPGVARPSDPLESDEIARYIDGWGRTGDVGLVAVADGVPVGAGWIRTFPADRHGYGYVRPEVPELTVAVIASHRHRGFGRALVTGLLDLATVHGAAQVSLSVAEAVNAPAAALYRSIGFAPVGVDPGGSTTMIAATTPAAPDTPADPPDPPGWAAPPGSVMSAEFTGPLPVGAATLLDGPALVRLRNVMFTAEGRGGPGPWIATMLRRWSHDGPVGPLLACVVDGADGRPVTSAIAEVTSGLPAPGIDDGRFVWLSSVATEPAWRRRGAADAVLTALLGRIDSVGMSQSRLAAAPGSERTYERFGFRHSAGPLMVRSQPGP